MKNRTMMRWGGMLLILATLGMALTGCGSGLPPDAKEAVLNTFDPIDKPRIDSAKQAKLLAVDMEAGAEEVWCVNLIYLCWTPPYAMSGEHTTCADGRLVRRIDDEWKVSIVVTEEDKANWEARGCELMPTIVDMPG